MKSLKVITAVFTTLAMMFVMNVSQATLISFTQVENDGHNISAQLSVDIQDTVDGVTFKFQNNVGEISSVTDIYFDQGDTNWFSGLEIRPGDQVGTDFSPTSITGSAANPTNLPGWNNIGFSADFSADSNNNPVNGLDVATDSITFLALAGADFSSYALFLQDVQAGKFRFGLKVTGYADGSSDTYVSVGAIPVPAAAWLFGTALFGFFATSRRKKNS